MFHYGSDHLSISKALQIARGEIKASISQESQKRIAQSHDYVLHMAQGQGAVYGINTGFGPLCNTRIKKEETSLLQQKLLLSHSVGIGKPISQELSKLMLILKVHALAKGHSGISPQIIERILWHIQEDVLPVVPSQGSVGASGDLAPLSHLFLPLLGEGEVDYKGQRLPSAQVLQQYHLEPVNLHPKAGLALINGTQFIAAHAVVLVEKMHATLNHADIIAAMMIEGLMASQSPFREELHQLRPHPAAQYVAKRMRQLLSDSEIQQAHVDCDKVQDPYSLRCVPQVHGASRSALLHLKQALEIEINSVTDNPIILSQNESISGGNFHGQPLALPIDYACLAASEVGNISDRRAYLSLEGKYEATPKLLMHDTGLNSGFMIVQYTGAALASENKSLCFPASADSIPTSLGQEDHVSMGSIAVRKALRVTRNLEKILAVELLCAAQAFDFRKPLHSSKTLDAVHALVRQHISHATQDRIFSKDILAALALIRSGALLQVANKTLEHAHPEFDQY